MGEPSLWNRHKDDSYNLANLFQPLMGEPSLWNSTHMYHDTVYCRAFQPLMGEPSLWNHIVPDYFGDNERFQPLMGEPSLWNLKQPLIPLPNPLVSTPHGRAVPLELGHRPVVGFWLVGFNPSWESRPSGTKA